MRIVSLVPAGTEILFALGAGPELVGVSHECELPARAPRPRLTRSVVDTAVLTSAEIETAIAGRVAAGTPLYEIDAEGLADLRPDVILSQGVCEVCALPASLLGAALEGIWPRPPVISLDARTLDGVLDSIRTVGAAIGRAPVADALLARLRARIGRVRQAVAACEPVPLAALEWLDPPYACGHWIPEMIACAGGHDLLGRPGRPSIPLEWAALAAACPPLVLAMPCGYDLDRAGAELREVAATDNWRQAVGDVPVWVAAGGGYFTCPGPRLVTGIEALAAMLHPRAVNWTMQPGVLARWC